MADYNHRRIFLKTSFKNIRPLLEKEGKFCAHDTLGYQIKLCTLSPPFQGG
ncbi:MAG: hypothetical protein JWQ09_2026, partial [Segetibacter sp.]|nr:hypothetical protein [Segetibacter sp.]